MKFFLSPHIRRLIDLALDEDQLGFDVTSNVFFSGTATEARLVTKEPMTLAGLPMVRAVFDRVDAEVEWKFESRDGDHVDSGHVIARAQGEAVSLLRGERTALNFLQRMTGIATMTARYVEALGDSSTRIVDTRKTLPGYRELDKYAVRMGGGTNHRYALGGGAMVKDNHIAAAGDVSKAVSMVRNEAPHTLKIEVEVERFAQIKPALDAGADVIMLDNMSTDDMVECIEFIRNESDHVTIEASGNITIERLPELSDIGLDFISSGALTHSVRAADISMRVDL